MSEPVPVQIHAGMQVPLFAKEGHPSPYSQADMNVLAKLANAFANSKIVNGPVNDFKLSEQNAVFQFASAVASGANGGNGNAFIVFGTINPPLSSVDYFSITDPNGGTNVVGIVVQKPAELRPSRLTEVLYDGTNYLTVSYTHNSAGTQRVAHVTGAVPNPSGQTWNDEVHTVIPQYFCQGTVNGAMYSSPIIAISYDGGFTYVDVNVAGRVWSSVSTDPNP